MLAGHAQAGYGFGMKQMIAFGMVVALAGCASLAPKPVEVVAPVAPPVVMPVMGQGASVAALDKTTAEQKAAAKAAPVAGARALGRVVVALGAPAEAGFWLKSGLVKAVAKGRVEIGGASVAVELRPGEGGALLSLAAYRALGLDLTDLPEVSVFAE